MGWYIKNITQDALQEHMLLYSTANGTSKTKEPFSAQLTENTWIMKFVPHWVIVKTKGKKEQRIYSLIWNTILKETVHVTTHEKSSFKFTYIEVVLLPALPKSYCFIASLLEAICALWSAWRTHRNGSSYVKILHELVMCKFFTID